MDAVAAVAEVIGWVGLAGAALFALLALVLRGVRGAWREATAELVDGEIRWFDDDGALQSAPDLGDLPPHDELSIHYRTRQPNEYYVHRAAHDESTYRFLALVLAGVAAVATVVNIVASLS